MLPLRAAVVLAMVVAAFVLGGCSSGVDYGVRADFDRGEFSRSAARLDSRLENDRSDRDYMLDRMRLGISLVADGRADAAEPVMNRAFELLRTQGINDDKTVAAAVFGEGGVIFWKGEPFEQAMMYHYIAVQKALRAEWDNARAAAQSSLFLLKDFGTNERGARKSTEEIARTAASRADESGGERAYDAYLDGGYTPAPSDFAMGSFMSGFANLAMFRAGGDPAREAEAVDHFREAFTIRPALKPVADALLSGGTNVLLIVDYGPGPEKVRYGPDGALARFVPRIAGDNRDMTVVIDGVAAGTFAIAHDLNAMASDHMWNNMEDVRQAKSTFGTLMLFGGAVAATSDNQTAQIVGLSLIGAGLLSKLTAGADTRHCEVLAQRTYLAAVHVARPGSTIDLKIGEQGARLMLPGIDPPPAHEPFRVVYVRIPTSSSAARWASSGVLYYANDATEARVPGDELPYILGGRCVRRPSFETLQRYQSAGNLTEYSVYDLENLYRAEGITFTDDPRRLVTAVHVLEGGDSMAAPAAGSAGFLRLFCQIHPEYVPKSREVAELAARLRPSISVAR